MMNKTVKERIFFAIKLFISFVLFDFVFEYIFTPSHIDLLRSSSIALGLSVGIAFCDKIFRIKEK